MIAKIALKSTIRHKWSSLVLLGVFAVATFITFWVFGFSNNFASVISSSTRETNGDIVIKSEFFKTQEVKVLLKQLNLYEIKYRRDIQIMISSNKWSGMKEVSDFDIVSLPKTKLQQGKLPEKNDEIVISTMFFKSKFNVGDTIFVTTFTPDKVINAGKFKVSGFGRTPGYLITKEGMELLINSDKYSNVITVNLSKNLPSRNEVKKARKEIEDILKLNKIKTNYVTDYYTEIDRMNVFMLFFNGLKIFLLAILFPLIGAVIGALVWIGVYKRRKEVWTYVSMGMRDGKVKKLLVYEYLFIAIGGIIAGLAAGYLTCYIAEATDSWLQFTYLMNIPLVAKVGPFDLLLIIAFIIASVSVWVRFPLDKIIKVKPFSY